MSAFPLLQLLTIHSHLYQNLGFQLRRRGHQVVCHFFGHLCYGEDMSVGVVMNIRSQTKSSIDAEPRIVTTIFFHE
jgi:hypothetical protein